MEAFILHCHMLMFKFKAYFKFLFHDSQEIILCYFIIINGFQAYTQKQKFSYLDVFKLEYVSDPQIAPNSSRIVYRRMGFDIMKDKADGNLWMINSDGSGHQKLSSREESEHSPRWSPSGDRIAFISTTSEGSEIYMYWLDSGKLAKISQLPFSPSSLTWSPKGDQLAFSMNVKKDPPVIAKIPQETRRCKVG